MGSSSSTYMDYAATTPILPSALQKMLLYMTHDGHFGNAGSRSHAFGWAAESAVEEARGILADTLGADVREIVFTSGATESNNLAIKGVADMAGCPSHFVTMTTEHKSVLDVMKRLEDIGHEVTYLNPMENGVLDIEDLIASLRDNTVLVSVMYVNNEIGVIQPIEEISRVCRSRGIKFHSDITQALGKLDCHIDKIEADLLSYSSHQLYGPKGVGGLYIRRKPRVRIVPQIHGGGQERGFRSGTLPVHQVVGFGEACRVANINREMEYLRIARLKNRLLDGLQSIEAIKINGDPAVSVPHIANVAFMGVEGESLMMAIEPYAVSSGSACTSSNLEPSYVTRALGGDVEYAHSSIRFSFGLYTDEAVIDGLLEKLRPAVARLRELSPLWELRSNGSTATPWETGEF